MARKDLVTEQLSLFGLKTTAHMRRKGVGQLSIDVFELSEPPKKIGVRHERTAPNG